jgi:hypothetical protein
MSSIIETAPVATWRKSSYSGDDTNPAQCVELADLADLVGAVKTGRYDR